MILLASILFTNGIELLGHRLKMHQSAVGSVLAAIGTALPETIIPIIAVLVFRDPKAMDVGIGAIAGAPFMLATLGLFVTGAAVILFSLLGRRTMEVRVAPAAVARDLTFFVVLYGVAVLTTFIPIYRPARGHRAGAAGVVRDLSEENAQRGRRGAGSARPALADAGVQGPAPDRPGSWRSWPDRWR